MREAILLIGPTGAGKTPLGQCFEGTGFAGRSCHHFDFGANLRSVSEGMSGFDLLTKDDRIFVRSVLSSGALLENENFYIAENILRSFIQLRCNTDEDIIILNGLPRHVGQANAVDMIIKVVLVICLDCSAEVVFDRIRLNSGGDRVDRSDDGLLQVKRKLEIFKERTIPLLDHYRTKDVKVQNIGVNTNTEPETIVFMIEQKSF